MQHCLYVYFASLPGTCGGVVANMSDSNTQFKHVPGVLVFLVSLQKNTINRNLLSSGVQEVDTYQQARITQCVSCRHMSSSTSWKPGQRLGIDIGRVLSQRNDAHNAPPYVGADPGAYAFCMLYAYHYGPDMLSIITRTKMGFPYNREGKPAWVTRFIEDMGLFDVGMPSENMQVVKTWEEKGERAEWLELAGFIDDTFDCLYSVWNARGSENVVCFGYANDSDGFRRTQIDPIDDFWNDIVYLNDWQHAAKIFKLPGLETGLWSLLSRRGPPNRRHERGVFKLIERHLNKHELHMPHPMASGPIRPGGAPERPKSSAQSSRSSTQSENVVYGGGDGSVVGAHGTDDWGDAAGWGDHGSSPVIDVDATGTDDWSDAAGWGDGSSPVTEVNAPGTDDWSDAAHDDTGVTNVTAGNEVATFEEDPKHYNKHNRISKSFNSLISMVFHILLTSLFSSCTILKSLKVYHNLFHAEFVFFPN